MPSRLLALAVLLAAAGCSRVSTLPDANAGGVIDQSWNGGELYSRGKIADQEYMKDQCPNGYYLVEDQHVQTGERAVSYGYSVPVYGARGVGVMFEHTKYVPVTNERIAYECAPPYTPAAR
jgi:hypothetical protein